jgi:hypothetical protein
MRSITSMLLLLLVALVVASSASAAQLIDRDAHGLTLRVNGKGEALLSYVSDGQSKHVLVWGAINALPPTRNRPQVHFRVDYSGGWGKYHRQLFAGEVYWRRFAGGCGRYTGPMLPYLVAACTAPDGSYWAAQQWPQPLPDLGFAPWLAAQRQQWLEVSHWSGPTAVLRGYPDWVYAGRYHDLFGNFTYRGQPVHGFATTRYGAPTDGYGRLIYLDTYDSAYGAGWRRENSFVSHNPTGAWCYGFYPTDPTKGGYQAPTGWSSLRGPGVGSEYRLLGEGPGVTPDVETLIRDAGNWTKTNPALVAFKEQESALLPSVIGADKLCRAGHDF